MAHIYIHYSVKENLISIEFKDFCESEAEDTSRVGLNLRQAGIPFSYKYGNIEIALSHFSGVDDINARVFKGFGRYDYMYRDMAGVREQRAVLCVRGRTLDTLISQALSVDSIEDLKGQRERLLMELERISTLTEHSINEYCRSQLTLDSAPVMNAGSAQPSL